MLAESCAHAASSRQACCCYWLARMQYRMSQGHAQLRAVLAETSPEPLKRSTANLVKQQKTQESIVHRQAGIPSYPAVVAPSTESSMPVSGPHMLTLGILCW